MELVSIELFNFRQFEAVDGLPQRVEFAPPGKANVTVVRGGVVTGKTAFMNALTWGLFGETTAGFGNPTRLVNENALAAVSDGETVHAFVRIEFRAAFEGLVTLHTLKRSVETSRGAEPSPDGNVAPLGELTLSFSAVGQGPVTLEGTGENRNYLNQILVRGPARYCFVGEGRFSNLASRQDAEKVRRVVDLVCGLSSLRSGERDLRRASLIFRKEGRRAAGEGDEGRTRLAEERARLCDDVAQAISAILQVERGVAREALEGRIRDLFNGLSVTSYEPRVSESFDLSLWSVEEGRDILGAGGETAFTLGFAFVGALIDLARSRNASWEFPLVLDQPFRQISRETQRSWLSSLPGYAIQVILLLNDSDWAHGVQGQLGERLGAEASFVFRGNHEPLDTSSILIQPIVLPAEGA
jgi:hypothetical protein